MIEEWIEYRKDDPATHPGFEGAYLVTILSKTGARYVEIRPFSFSSLFAGDWSRYSVQAWRPVPAAFGGTATAQQIAWGLTFSPFKCATIMTGLKNLLDLYSELIKRIPSLAEVSACQKFFGSALPPALPGSSLQPQRWRGFSDGVRILITL